MIFIGIDPGMLGGVGVINGDIVKAIDTPIITPAKGKREYDIQGMVSILMREASLVEPVHVVIESVHSMPSQGVSSSFGFGKGFGIWLGIIGALQLPSTLVTPQRWKAALLDGCNKDLARLRAQQLFPKSASLFARKKDDGRAEAVLMAEWGRRTIVGNMDEREQVIGVPAPSTVEALNKLQVAQKIPQCRV